MKNFLIIEERFCGKTYSAQNHMLKGNNYSEITTVNNLVFWLFFKKNIKAVFTPPDWIVPSERLPVSLSLGLLWHREEFAT